MKRKGYTVFDPKDEDEEQRIKPVTSMQNAEQQRVEIVRLMKEVFNKRRPLK